MLIFRHEYRFFEKFTSLIFTYKVCFLFSKFIHVVFNAKGLFNLVLEPNWMHSFLEQNLTKKYPIKFVLVVIIVENLYQQTFSIQEVCLFYIVFNVGSYET